MESIKQKIQASGLKATPQRIAIYEIMERLGHASADMVSCELSKSYPSMTMATVYNVLESFENAGLLSKRCSPNNKMYFDITTYEHLHLFDSENNVYADYEDPELLELVKKHLEKKGIEGFEAQRIDIQIIGKSIEGAKV